MERLTLQNHASTWLSSVSINLIVRLIRSNLNALSYVEFVATVTKLYIRNNFALSVRLPDAVIYITFVSLHWKPAAINYPQSAAISYDGTWYDKSEKTLQGTISGDTLTWENGREFSLTFDEQSRIVLNVEEDTYLGELTHDGNIQWSSGDTWINLGTDSGTNPGIIIFFFLLGFDSMA